MRRFLVTLIVLLFLTSFCIAKSKNETPDNDYFYSTQYFNDLIDTAEMYREQELKKQNDIVYEELDEEILSDIEEPFHLRIEKGRQTPIYKDSFKKIDTKTVMPISDKFCFMHDTSTTRSKYNSQDYKILTGAEFQPFKYINLTSGIETNYRGLDQNPASRKLYFSPVLQLGDRVSIKFHNKMNIQNYSSDHDISLNVSPFKSNIMDFGIYSGLTRRHNGTISESINFSTNFYF